MNKISLGRYMKEGVTLEVEEYVEVRLFLKFSSRIEIRRSSIVPWPMKASKVLRCSDLILKSFCKERRTALRCWIVPLDLCSSYVIT